jgi:hypothetical protein
METSLATATVTTWWVPQKGLLWERSRESKSAILMVSPLVTAKVMRWWVKLTGLPSRGI